MESQIFCHAQAIILWAITIWALARFMLTAGWFDNFNLKYSCVGVLPLALSRTLRVINEHKCLWYMRHDLIVPKCSPINTQYIRFALNQSIDGYLLLPRAARGRRLATRS
jgi:hypothetical protein